MNAAHLPKLMAFARSDQDQLIAQLRCLTVENRILRKKLPKRISLAKRERWRLVRFGMAVGPDLREIISVVQYSTFQNVASFKRAQETEIERKTRSSAHESGSEEAGSSDGQDSRLGIHADPRRTPKARDDVGLSINRAIDPEGARHRASS